MSVLENVKYFSDLIIAFSVLLGVIYLIFIGGKIIKQIEKSKETDSATDNRKFYSNYSDERLLLERKIADLNLKLTQSVSQFEDVNHLILRGQREGKYFSLDSLNPDNFLRTLSIDRSEIKVDRNLVFVLTPFHPSERRTYSAIVRGLSSFGIRVIRGDEESIKGDILSHIIVRMLSARIIIANINTRNPNVMYELGIAHALGKDVVMISNTKEELPFDVNSRRILFYSDHKDLTNKLQRELAQKIFEGPN